MGDRPLALPKRRVLALIFICCLLTGCFKLGPEFKRPEVEVPDRWQNSKLKSMQSGDYRQWWRTFQDPVLSRLVAMAHEQNLDLQIAAVRIVEARAQLGVAKGSLFPQTQQFKTDLAYNKLSEHMPNINRYSFGTYDIGFDALWEIDIWGKFRRGIEAADANLAATQLDYDAVLVSLTAEVAAAYVQLRTAQQRLALAQKNAELQAHSLRITEALQRNNLGTGLDTQQAKALLNNTRATVAELEMEVRQTRNALCLLLAKPPGGLDALLEENQPIPETSGEILVGIPADLLRRRPDVRREEMKAAAQSSMIGVAKAELYPRFSLQGSIGLASSSANGVDVFDVLSAQTLTGKFGPTVIWPILNYGRLKNNVRIQDAKLEQLLIAYQRSVLRALREVENALIALQKNREQVAQLRQGVKASQQAAHIALLQYRNGLEDYTRVLNSQQLLVQEQDRLASNQGNTARQIIAVYKALGGGWEIGQGRQILPKKIRDDMKTRTDWDGLLD